MKLRLLFILILLTQLTLAESYTSYENAVINVKLSSDMDLIPTGSNPKILEAEAVLNLRPLETKNQEIIYLKISAEPDANIEKDSDKIIFTWKNVREDIYYKVESQIKTKTMPLIIRENIRYPTSFESRFSKYTQEEKYIDINTEIENLADELFKDQTNLLQATHNVAQYIEENIEYRRTIETENKNKKSSWVLNNKYGVCDELTNLFISILRVKKIPSKFISGIVYSTANEKFENHGWAEVYFKDYGWLPFDLTYAQHGWIDITHIKLAESKDSGISSIDYHWRSSDLDVEVNKLNTIANFENLGSNILEVLTTAVEPIETKVGFGSYVPIKVTIENPTSFYIIPSIHLTKSPQLIDRNKKTLLLKPKEIKSVYFTTKIPEKLNKDYIFKSEIETFVSFSKPSSTIIEFSSDYPVMTQQEAESIIQKSLEKELKQEFTTISLDCTTKESTYYENEVVEVFCVIKNKRKDTKKFNLCLLDNCKSITLKELEEKLETFRTGATNKIIISAENEKIRYSTIDLNIIKPPNIVVKTIQPLVIDYNEEVDLKIELESIIPAHNLIIYLGKQEILNTNLLHGKKTITTKVRGKNLINDIKLKMQYKDSLGKEYEKTDKYLVTIKNRPWYTYLFGWLL